MLYYYITASYWKSKFKVYLKVATNEKIGGSGVTSTLGTWYGTNICIMVRTSLKASPFSLVTTFNKT
jgi:hypothetical protein